MTTAITWVPTSDAGWYKSVICALDLRRPIYYPTAAYGHFGRTEDTCSWEKTEHAAALQEAANA